MTSRQGIYYNSKSAVGFNVSPRFGDVKEDPVGSVHSSLCYTRSSLHLLSGCFLGVSAHRRN